jgi:thiamine pyrophosphate-dependent acetolactate synthase large subunit-like protein
METREKSGDAQNSTSAAAKWTRRSGRAILSRQVLSFGTSIATKDFYGVELNGVNYEHAAAMVGGYGQRVEASGELKNAAKEALKAVASRKSAILNMIMPTKVR